MKQVIKYGLLSFLLLMVATLATTAQKKDKQQNFEEEIIRYLGYEEIPVRYISLPYDATMYHNVEGNFMDIGFVLLMFIPLIFLWRTRSRIWRIVLFTMLGLMWIFSLGSSHVLAKTGEKLFNDGEMIPSYLAGGGGNFLADLVSRVYVFAGAIYAPIGSLLATITDSGDHITYVLLLGILYILYFVYSKFSQQAAGNYLLGALLLFYCFFMLILSAGIIWYGFLLFPLLYLEVTRYAQVSKFYKSLLLGAGGLFIVMSYFLKVSNTKYRNDIAMGTVQPPVLAYNFSESGESDVYEGYFKNIGPAIEKINAEDSTLIFQSGTFTTFLIRNNSERVFKDGILNMHSQMVDRYKRKSVVNEAMKANGFKYIVVSPVLHIMDQTPDKSLTKKFQKMVSYLHDNAGLQLLATDRLVQVADENGNSSNEYDFLFGPDVQVVQNGSYAIFELL